MNRNRIWDRGWVLVRPVWTPSGLLQTVLMWCFYCGLFSLDKLFCMCSTLTLGYLLVIYLMSSWCLCSFPIWCLGQKCQFSRALLIYGLGLKVDERQWSETVTIKFLIKQTLIYLLDNIYIRFGTKLYRQIVGIPMGTNCAPLVADLFLFCYERDFMTSLSDVKQAEIIEAFKSTSRYLDDLLTIDNPYLLWKHGQSY